MYNWLVPELTNHALALVNIVKLAKTVIKMADAITKNTLLDQKNLSICGLFRGKGAWIIFYFD
jgi:hypothetical protein